MSKKASKKPSDSLEDFLKREHSVNRGGVPCLVCSNPEILEETRRFRKALAEGETNLPWSVFWKFRLKGELGWNGSYSALMGHVRNHEPKEA